ncbi:MAG: ATP-binding cassette domain-containing protein [Patescibacteria group bacterium]
MSSSVIRAINLKKAFFVGKNAIDALRGINMEIDAGDFVVIYGPSGCGKTTLLSLLAGLDSPTSGNVIVRDVDLNRLSQDELAAYRRNKIGIVFQQFNLVPTLSAIENIALPLLLSGTSKKKSIARAGELLQAVGLGDRGTHKPGEMSGGQQQRVAIARALAANPWILFVDEPTGNLDIPTGDEVMKILKQVNDWGRTIVLVTHNPEYVKYGDKVYHMEDGKIARAQINSNKNRIDAKDNPALKYYFSDKKSGGMRFFESLHIAKIHFLSKKLRTFLTTLGVALGVGSIVTLVSLAIGLQQITQSQLASFDTLRTITLSVSKDSLNKLDDKTAEDLINVDHVTLVSPTLNQTAKARLNDSTSQILLQGINLEALDFEGIKLEAGKKFDDDSIIISKAAAKNFDVKDLNSIIGTTIKVDILVVPANQSFSFDQLSQTKLISIDKTIAGVSGDDLIAAVYMPLSAVKTISGLSDYSSMKVKTDDRKNVAPVRDQIEKKGFKTTSVVDLIEQVDKVFLIAQIILGVIGGVALVVALIGIVNIMTISLLERTHEVGIIKAIGATNKDVQKIFEYEVILFGLCGGVAGVGGAWLFGEFINIMIQYLMRLSNIAGEMVIFITPLYFALEVITLTVFVSMLAGFYPARRASKLSPMEALRYE